MTLPAGLAVTPEARAKLEQMVADRPHIPFTGEAVKCYGCEREVPDRRGYWSRSGKYMLCGPQCPGTSTTKDPSVFAYFKAWVRKEAVR